MAPVTTTLPSAPRLDDAPLVLVVDDEPGVSDVLEHLLRSEGLRCAVAADGRIAVDRALELRPQLILLDLSLPSLSGDEVFARLRSDHRTRYTPVIFLTAAGNRNDLIRRLLAGGDDYVTKPFDIDELAARIHAALRRARTLSGLNPISGLPGNAAIHEEMTGRLLRGETFACVYLDIDNFKPFNDHYGFSRGDALIRALAESTFAAVSGLTPDPFLGHIGGDDFVILCGADQAEALAADVLARFSSAGRAAHDDIDVAAHGYQAVDRRGIRSTWPLAAASAGIVIVTPQRFPSAAAVAQTAAEMKTLAKFRGGDQVAVDRRRGTDGPVPDRA